MNFKRISESVSSISKIIDWSISLIDFKILCPLPSEGIYACKTSLPYNTIMEHEQSVAKAFIATE